MFQLIRNLFATKAPAARRAQKRRVHLAVEALETRLVPTGLTYQGGPLLTHVEVTPVFFGPAWTTNPTNQTLSGQLNTFVGRLVNSSYLDQLSEYSEPGKTIGRGTSSAPDVTSNGWVTHAPVSGTAIPMIADSDITNMLKSEIVPGKLPAPDANRLYVVYVAPNTTVTDHNGFNSASATNGFTGYHFASTDLSGRTFYYAVVVDPTAYRSGGYPLGAPSGLPPFQYDTLTTFDEVAEAITDPDVKTGWFDTDPEDKTTTPATIGGEVGDLANLLVAPGKLGGYILDGYDVQQEWSNSFRGPLLNNQNFVVTGGTLMVFGDQDQANQADTLTLDVVAGSTQVTMNGVTVTFAPGTVSSIMLFVGGGNNTVNVLNSPGSVGISSFGYDSVTLGNGSLAGIGGAVSISNSAGTTSLNVDDHADPTARTITMNQSSVSFAGYASVSWSGVFYLALHGGSGGNTINVNDTIHHGWTDLWSGSGSDTLVVAQTSQPLDIYTGVGSNTVAVHAAAQLLDIVGGGNDTVNLGFNGSVQSITGPVTVTNPPSFTTLNIDDSADLTGRTVTITNAGITGLAALATINYQQNDVQALNVSGGLGGNTFTISSTLLTHLTTLHTGGGNDTVKIAPSSSSVIGPLSIDGGLGINTLDYSGFTGIVTVDLLLSFATDTQAVSNIQNVIGGHGDNLLVGGGANDVLTGGTGRNLIIDGFNGVSQARLIGGGGDNLLIGGFTAFDRNLTALDALFAEWTRTDETTAQRIAHLRTGGGVNGSLALNASTLFESSAHDTLTGGLGTNWFLAGTTDTVLNKHLGDQTN